MTLTLYCFEGCPYCTLVKDFMLKNNISIPVKDIHKSAAARAELLKIGGKTQVPCLVIDGRALYESLDIIDWLKDNCEES